MKNQLNQILKQAKELKNNEDHYEEQLNNSEDEDDILSRLEKSVDSRSGNIRQSLSRENFNLNDREAGGFKTQNPNPFNPYLSNQNYAFSQRSGMSAEDQFKMMMDLQQRFKKMDKPFKKKKKKNKKDKKRHKEKKRRSKVSPSHSRSNLHQASFSSVSQHLLNNNPTSLASSRYSGSNYP